MVVAGRIVIADDLIMKMDRGPVCNELFLYLISETDLNSK